MYSRRLKIADIVFSICDESPIDIFLNRGNSYDDFLCDETPGVVIRGHSSGFTENLLDKSEKIFSSGTFWDIYKKDDRTIFSLSLPFGGRNPYCIAVLRNDFRDGDVFYATDEKSGIGLHSHPLAFPMFHLLMVSLLGQDAGLFIHACGIDDNGVGYLFPGSSGCGKTTIAGLWKDGAAVLNDERIILRRRGNSFWIYGTPWHGEHERVSSHGVPLEKIFFLQKADSSDARRFNGVRAASFFLTHCFFPYWDPEAMNGMLDTCSKVIENIPAYILDFVPDKDVIDLIRCVK